MLAMAQTVFENRMHYTLVASPSVQISVEGDGSWVRSKVRTVGPLQSDRLWWLLSEWVALS